MTFGTGRGKSRRVYRVAGHLVVLEVTASAIHRETCCEVQIRVTALTLQGDMRSLERETGERMVKAPRPPGECRVALCTIRRKSRRRVVRAGGHPELFDMASIAVHRSIEEAHGGPIGRWMTRGAVGAQVRSRQRES